MNRIHERMEARGETLYKVFTAGESTGLYKQGRMKRRLRSGKHSVFPQIELISFTLEIANLYARIRAGYRLLAADAIHLATAAHAGVDLFD